MKKMFFLKQLLCFCIIGSSFLPAVPTDDFRESAAIVLSLAGNIEDELCPGYDITLFIGQLQSALEQSLSIWEPLSLDERNELEEEVNCVCKTVLRCFTLIRARALPRLYVQRPELPMLLRRFVIEEIRDLFTAVDTCNEADRSTEAQELLISIRQGVQERTDLSRADKRIIDNLVRTYLYEIGCDVESKSTVSHRDSFDGPHSERASSSLGEPSRMNLRRNGICCGIVPPLRHLPPAMTAGDDDVSIAQPCAEPNDPEALLSRIFQSLSTAAFLIRERAESGGASTSDEAPIPLQPLLDDIHNMLLKAHLLGYDPRAIREGELRLEKLQGELAKI